MEEPAVSIVKVSLIKNTVSFQSQHNSVIQTNQLHISATVSSHHQADPKNKKKKCTAAIMVGDFGPHIVLHKIHIYMYIILILIHLLTAVGFTPGSSSTVHNYTQTMHRKTQLTTKWEECGPCPVFASYTLAFALQLRKKHGKTSFRVAEECQLAR
jgi:hypothetical protein